MCVGPTTMMMAASAASALLSAADTYFTTQKKNTQAKYSAQLSQGQAEAARQEGDYAQALALRDSVKKRQEAAQALGRQRAAMGASGVVVDTGSYKDVIGDMAAFGETEALAILEQGNLQAWRAENTARGHDASASQALGTITSPLAAAGTSLLYSSLKMGESYAGSLASRK